MELFGSIWVWASGLSAPAELLLGEPSGLSEHGLTALLRRPAGGAKAPLTRGRRTLCPQTGLGDQLALWAELARDCPLCSGGPQGAPKPPLTRGRRTLCPQTGLGDQLAGAFSPQGRQRSGFWKRGCVQAERSGFVSVPQQGGAAGGKQDEVDVSCVQQSADRRSISEDLGAGGELHVQNGGFSVRFLLDDLEDDQ